jgi:hypothetical protein
MRAQIPYRVFHEFGDHAHSVSSGKFLFMS